MDMPTSCTPSGWPCIWIRPQNFASGSDLPVHWLRLLLVSAIIAINRFFHRRQLAGVATLMSMLVILLKDLPCTEYGVGTEDMVENDINRIRTYVFQKKCQDEVLDYSNRLEKHTKPPAATFNIS